MSSPQFYSDRICGPVPRTHETFTESTAEDPKALITRLIRGDWLAKTFPFYCPDGNGVTCTNQDDIGLDLSALVPSVMWPLWQDAGSDETLFDVLEYVGQQVAKPSYGEWHSFFRHYELRFDEKTGQAEFRTDVNLLLSRGGTLFEMTPHDVEIQHRAPSTGGQGTIRCPAPRALEDPINQLPARFPVTAKLSWSVSIRHWIHDALPSLYQVMTRHSSLLHDTIGRCASAVRRCARAAELAPRWSEVGCRQHLGRGGGAVGRTTVEIVRTAVAHCESVHAGESDRR